MPLQWIEWLFLADIVILIAGRYISFPSCIYSYVYRFIRNGPSISRYFQLPGLEPLCRQVAYMYTYYGAYCPSALITSGYLTCPKFPISRFISIQYVSCISPKHHCAAVAILNTYLSQFIPSWPPCFYRFSKRFKKYLGLAIREESWGRDQSSY